MRYKKTVSSTLALVVAVALSAPVWSQSMSAGGAAKAGAAAPSDDAVRTVQEALKEKGHYTGPIDGQWGAETQAALREFQQSSGLDATGQLDPETRKQLGMSGE